MRISRVGFIRVLSVQLSSVLQTGDADTLAPYSEAFAVQRQYPVFQGNEGDDAYLKRYPSFVEPFTTSIIKERIGLSVMNEAPFIDVGAVEILGISNAAIFQIGSNRIIDAKSRTKHVRQLVSVQRPQGEAAT